jgi:ADP-ribosylglycohydrolase
MIERDKISFEAVIYHVLMLGGDTDTNACIVGSMIGAYLGY